MHHFDRSNISGDAAYLGNERKVARRLNRRRRASWQVLIEVGLVSLVAAGLWTAARFDRDRYATALFGSLDGYRSGELVLASLDASSSSASGKAVALETSNELRPGLPTSDEGPSIATPAPTPKREERKPETAPTAVGTAKVEAYLTSAQRLVGLGDVAAARLLLTRAAAGNDPRALVALAETYDPVVLRRWRVIGIPPDAERARALYRKAAETPAREHLMAME